MENVVEEIAGIVGASTRLVPVLVGCLIGCLTHYAFHKFVAKRLPLPPLFRTQRSSTRDDLLRLLNDVPGMVYSFKVDKNGRRSFPFVSNGAESVYGVKPEDIMNDAEMTVFRTPIVRSYRRPFEESVKESYRTMETWKFECPIIVDGEQKWIRCVSAPEKVPGEKGSVIWHGHLMDITMWKEAEQRMKEEERRRRAAEEMVHRQKEELFVSQLIMEAQALQSQLETNTMLQEAETQRFQKRLKQLHHQINSLKVTKTKLQKVYMKHVAQTASSDGSGDEAGAAGGGGGGGTDAERKRARARRRKMKYKEAIKNVLIAEGDGAWDPLLSLAEMPAVQESPHEDEGDTSSGEAGEEGGGDAKAAAPPSTRDLDEWGFPVATTS